MESLAVRHSRWFQPGVWSVVGALALGPVVPVLAAPQDQSAPPVVVSQTKSPLEEWNEEMAAAKLRRTNGRHLEVGGFFVAVGADLLAGAIIAHCRAADCAFAPIVGLTGIVGGVTMGFVGKARAQDANAEITALLTRKPGGPAGVTLQLGANSPLSIVVGQTTSVSYRVRW